MNCYNFKNSMIVTLEILNNVDPRIKNFSFCTSGVKIVCLGLVSCFTTLKKRLKVVIVMT